MFMATFDSLCFAKSQAGGVPEKKEDQREEGVTLYCSRLRISRTNAKPSLHHVRGIVCRTHSCGLWCQCIVLCLSSLYAMPCPNTHYTQTLVFPVVHRWNFDKINKLKLCVDKHIFPEWNREIVNSHHSHHLIRRRVLHQSVYFFTTQGNIFKGVLLSWLTGYDYFWTAA